MKRCDSQCKNNKFKANHNNAVFSSNLDEDVIRSAKIINLKQITTEENRFTQKRRCDSQCKNNKFKANHNNISY